MTKRTGKWALTAFFAIVPLILTQTVQAQTPETAKVTYITTDHAIELPGQVLPAGHYLMKLVNLGTVRNVVRIMSPNRKTVYGTWQTAPSFRLQAVSDNTFTFYEAPKGVPPALHTWFYHGTQWGFNFLYPKAQADRIAEYNGQNVLRTPEATETAQAETPAADNNAMAATQPAESPSAVDQGNKADQGDNEMAASQAPAEQAAPSSDNTQTAPQQMAAVEPPASQATPTPSAVPSELPKTASSEPLLGLVGLLSMFAAFGVRRMRKQETH